MIGNITSFRTCDNFGGSSTSCAFHGKQPVNALSRNIRAMTMDNRSDQ